MPTEPTPYTTINVDCFISGKYFYRISFQTTSSMRKVVFFGENNEQLSMLIPLSALADFQTALTNTTSTNKTLLAD